MNDEYRAAADQEGREVRGPHTADPHHRHVDQQPGDTGLARVQAVLERRKRRDHR
jgi:hypothetical protein